MELIQGPIPRYQSQSSPLKNVFQEVTPVGLNTKSVSAEGVVRKHPSVMYQSDPVQEALDLKPKSLKCMINNGSIIEVIVWSGHSTNEQFVLHVNNACSTAIKMGLIHSTMPKRHMTQNREKGKLVFLSLPITP